jgi:hypothetical protein
VGEDRQSRRFALAEIISFISNGGIPLFAGWRIVELDVKKIFAEINGEIHDSVLKAILWQGYYDHPRTLFVIEDFDYLVYWKAPLLKPFLARNQMYFVGTATLADYRVHIERDAAIGRRCDCLVLEWIL